MRLGLNLGYWANAEQAQRNLAYTQEAERLGYSVVWAAEAYGSDNPATLAWLAAQTERIELGSAIMQIPARQPAATAMTAATIDTLSGGRFRLGLGVSGPQVSEGWYGVPFSKPLARTREYIDIVKKVLSRKTVTYEGKHYTLPLPDGPGKALKLSLHPHRTDIPVYLASIGPKNLELTGELADGWLAIFLEPEAAAEHLAHLAKGRAKVGKTLEGFDIAPAVPIVIGEDPEMCAEMVKGYASLYIGGMGSKEHNFYHALATRMGYGDAADEIQEHFLNKRYREAMAAVPFEFVDRTSLLGPVERIAERLKAYAEAGVTTLSVVSFDSDVEDGIETLRGAAKAFELAGVSE
ncbi:LLM class F420-dependent oxidoreductase [Longispora albida]|uniref:LLM class F420-dependent oxidoreductase n=1 Tax=Longispora albida TaxID=203523 RepID=UPI000381FBDA|nr:LLM class F420-dependent oxidoreductase [Longispora albida]